MSNGGDCRTAPATPGLLTISEEVEKKIISESLADVNLVIKEEVEKAAAALEPGKGDPLYSSSSHCLKVESEILSEYIAHLFMFLFLIHNYIPQIMLLLTLVSIIKDKLEAIIHLRITGVYA